MTVLPPEACQTMVEVRAGVDALDQELVALLARRFGYMDAAARIKPSRSDVRDEARKAQVIANASAAAAAAGAPAVVGLRLRGQSAGLAIEAQNWPDAPNHASFPSIEMKPGEACEQVTEWRFNRS